MAVVAVEDALTDEEALEAAVVGFEPVLAG
jgi:hypothetical protein